MHQKDFSLGERMNITCDAVFANQADTNEFSIRATDDYTWKMITTETRGVGLNRNLALLMSDAEIILFADDDITYYDGTFGAIAQAFVDRQDADVIIFSVDLARNGEIFEKRRVPGKRMHIWNSLKYGTYVIAARRQSILKANIQFNQFFGGGCIYGSGEDSLFLKACFDKKLKVYSCNHVLGACRKDVSSWFSGYDEKFFFDKGASLTYLFPKTKYLFVFYFAHKFNKGDFGFAKRMRWMLKGMRAGNTLMTFQQVTNGG